MSERSVAVIDGNSLLHRAYHAVSPTMNAPDGTPTNAVFGFMQMLLKMIEDYHPDGIICAWDVHRPDWRMKLLDRYKAQRPPMDNDLAVQFPIIRGLLESMKIPCISMEGFEGDDILGTFAAKGEEAGVRVYLITGDKDAYQLASETTSIVTTKKGMSDVTVYTPEKVKERYGVGPELVPDFLGLKGDPSDNIPGVPGIGEKTAAKLLNQYGSLEEIIAHADEINGKMGKNVREHVEDARISRDVATIRRDAPVELDINEVSFPSYTAEDVTEAFGALHFNRHLKTVLGLIGSTGASTPGAPTETSALVYTKADDAEAFVENAINENRWIAVELDEPEELNFFTNETSLTFSDGTGIATAPIAKGTPLVAAIIEEGKLAGSDIKHLIRTLWPTIDEAESLLGSLIDDERVSDRIFDCGVAAYLLDSNSADYSAAKLAERYLGTLKPEGADAPTPGQFAAAASAALVGVLDKLLHEDESWDLFATIEMPLLPVLAQMEITGVDIDIAQLEALSKELSGQIDTLHAEIIELAEESFNVDSPKQLGHILFDVLGLDTRKSKKTKTGWSTNAKVLEKLADDHPLPAKVIEYRELAKLRSTYLDALPALVDKRDGRVHTTFNQTVTATGRLSSSEPNLQNIPVRTELGRRIREAFVAPGDGVFVSGDYSQIELRLLAHLSGDEGLIAAFRSGEDFHAHTAAGIFDVPVEEVTPQMRSRAKAVNFGIVYGQQAFGLSQSLHISMAEAQEMIDRYYTAYPQVRIYLDDVVADAHEKGYAITMFGRKRHIAELKSSNANLRHFGERTAMNHPMQGTAADIIKIAMVEVARKLRADGFASRMVLQVHDELDFECPANEVEKLSRMVEETMDNVVELKVPLLADVQSGPNWAIAH